MFSTLINDSSVAIDLILKYYRIWSTSLLVLSPKDLCMCRGIMVQDPFGFLFTFLGQTC